MKKLRVPEPVDPVYLVNCRILAASMIEPLLMENSIPYSKNGAMGAALATYLVSAFELFNIYVPYAAYPKAYKLITDVFGEDNDIMSRLAHYDIESPES